MDIDNEVIDCRYLLGPAESAERCRTIRSLLDGSTLDHAKALLVVGGVDSRDEIANTMILNYLFCGTQDHVLGVQALEDTMLIMTKEQCTVYTTPPALQLVTHMTSGWGCVEVLCMPTADFADQYLFEDHKMEAFRSMVKPHMNIGVVFDVATSKYGTDPVKVIEKWPMIQSYAVDESGQRPFFTMAKKVINVWEMEPFRTLLSTVDTAEAERIQLHDVSMFRFQWNAALEAIDRNRSEVAMDVEKACEFALDPLQAFFTYGKMASTSTAAVAAPTAQLTVSKKAMILAATHPRGSLSIARTYSLSTSSQDPEVQQISATTATLNAVFSSTSMEGIADATALVGTLQAATANVQATISAQPLAFHNAIAISAVVPGTSLTYTDTFLFVGGRFVNVTTNITPLACFTATSAELQQEAPNTLEGLVKASIGTVMDDITPGDGLTVVTANGVAAGHTSLVLCERGFYLKSKRLGVLGPLCVVEEATASTVAYRVGDITDKIALQVCGTNGFLAAVGGKVWIFAKPSSFARRLLHAAIQDWKAQNAKNLVADGVEAAPPVVVDLTLRSQRPAKPAVDLNTAENVEASWREQRQYLQKLLPEATWPKPSILPAAGANNVASFNAAVIVLTANPGVDTHAAVDKLHSSATKAGKRVAIYTPPEPAQGAVASRTELRADHLSAFLAQASNQKDTVVIVCNPYFHPIEQLIHVIANAKATQNLSLQLHSVVAVVGTELFFQDYVNAPPRHIAPGISLSATAGFITHALILGKSGTSQYLSRIENFIRCAHEGVEVKALYDVSALDGEFVSAVGAHASAEVILNKARPVVLPAPVEHIVVRVQREKLAEPALMDFLSQVRSGSVSSGGSVLFLEAHVVLNERKTHLMVAIGNNAFSSVVEKNLEANLLHDFHFYGVGLIEKRLNSAVKMLKMVQKADE